MDDASKNPRHSPFAWAGLAMVALVIVAVVVLFLARGGDSGGDATAASGTAPAGSAAAGTDAGGSAAGSSQISGADSVALAQVRQKSEEPLLDGGKPLVFFMGTQWCPFCASERWALVAATSRFGKWTGLGELHSRNGEDYFQALPTYDLTGATYASEYIGVRHKELDTVDGDPLEKLGSLEEELVNENDQWGGIPFLFVGGPGGRYTVDLAFSPGLLQGQTFAELRKDVADGAPTEAVEAIGAQTDAITALICKVDGQQPASVCAKDPIPALESEIE
jgi:thiol-disulfide isomerase/thioredoxin